MFTYILIAYVVLGVLTGLVMGGYAFIGYGLLGRHYSFSRAEFGVSVGLACLIGMAGGVSWPWVWYKKLRERLSP